MASLIESVRKLHGPTLVEHDNGYDVDVICPECTRLRSEALEQASKDDEARDCAVELAHVPYPCPTRVVAGTSAAEGKHESARMRLEHLVVQREQLEERMERLEAVIGLIRRDLDDTTDEASPDAADKGPDVHVGQVGTMEDAPMGQDVDVNSASSDPGYEF